MHHSLKTSHLRYLELGMLKKLPEAQSIDASWISRTMHILKTTIYKYLTPAEDLILFLRMKFILKKQDP
jgi:hypothetical protein